MFNTRKNLSIIFLLFIILTSLMFSNFMNHFIEGMASNVTIDDVFNQLKNNDGDDFASVSNINDYLSELDDTLKETVRTKLEVFENDSIALSDFKTLLDEHPELVKFIESKIDNFQYNSDDNVPPPTMESPGPSPMMESISYSPMMESTGSSPMMESTGSSPMMESTGSSPMMESTSSSPMMESTSSSPMMESTGSSPMMESTSDTSNAPGTEPFQTRLTPIPYKKNSPNKISMSNDPLRKQTNTNSVFNRLFEFSSRQQFHLKNP